MPCHPVLCHQHYCATLYHVTWCWLCHDAPCRGASHAVTPHATLAVLHSGDYFLFESDSEEEDEAAVPLPEEPRPNRQSAFQVSTAGGAWGVQGCSWGADSPSTPKIAYQAWVTNTRTALQQQEQQEQPEPPGAEVAAGGSGSPQNGAGGREGTRLCPTPTVCRSSCWQCVMGHHLNGVTGLCGLPGGCTRVGHKPCAGFQAGWGGQGMGP